MRSHGLRPARCSGLWSRKCPRTVRTPWPVSSLHTSPPTCLTLIALPFFALCCHTEAPKAQQLPMDSRMTSEPFCSKSDSQEGVEKSGIAEIMIASGKWCSDVRGSCDYTNATESSYDGSLSSDDGSANSAPADFTDRNVALTQTPHNSSLPEAQRDLSAAEDAFRPQLRTTELGKIAKTIGKIEKPITRIHELVESGELGWEKPEWVLTCPLRETEKGVQAKSLGELRPRTFNIRSYENASILRTQKSRLSTVPQRRLSESSEAIDRCDDRWMDTTSSHVEEGCNDCDQQLECIVSYDARSGPNDDVLPDPSNATIAEDEAMSDLGTETVSKRESSSCDIPSTEDNFQCAKQDIASTLSEESGTAILEPNDEVETMRLQSDETNPSSPCVCQVEPMIPNSTGSEPVSTNPTEQGCQSPVRNPALEQVPLESTTSPVDQVEPLHQYSTTSTYEATDTSQESCQSPVRNPFLAQVQLKSAKRNRPRPRYSGFMNDMATQIEALYD